MARADPHSPLEVAPESGRGKRSRTRASILANAIALFRERGVRATRLADIAAACEIAPATLFNHFPTRAHLAEGWVRGEIAEALSASLAADASSSAGPRNLRVVLRSVGAGLAKAGSAEPTRRLEAWREVDRVRREPPPPALSTAIRGAQERGQLRADRGAEVLAEMLLDAIEGALIEGLTSFGDGEAPPDVEAGLRQRLRDRVDLVLDGARKRNERVRLSGGLGPEAPGGSDGSGGKPAASAKPSDGATSEGTSSWS